MEEGFCNVISFRIVNYEICSGATMIDHGVHSLMFCFGSAGGVAEMNSFLEKFFPTVVVNKRREAELGEGSLYCQYNNQNLQAYNSALYLAAFVSTWFSSYVTRHYGRKGSILVAGISFLMGVTLRASAQNLAMLVIGQSLLGWGLGFSNQVGFNILHFSLDLTMLSCF